MDVGVFLKHSQHSDPPNGTDSAAEANQSARETGPTGSSGYIVLTWDRYQPKTRMSFALPEPV